MNPKSNMNDNGRIIDSNRCILLADVKHFVGPQVFAALQGTLGEIENYHQPTYEFLRRICVIEIILKCRTSSIPTVPINLTELLSSVVRAVKLSGITNLSIDTIDIDLVINANSYILTNCIFEIVRNSIQNSNGCDDIIRVSAVNGVSEVVLSFWDSGPGIDNNVKSCLTYPFFKIKSLDSHDSHGLGLTMVNYAASRFGGTLKISCSAEYGNMVSLSLPKYCVGNKRCSTFDAEELLTDALSPLHIHLHEYFNK